jgi:hypothetical protein
MKFEFSHELVMFMGLEIINNVEYYIKTESRKSSALIYAVLTKQAKHGGRTIEG